MPASSIRPHVQFPPLKWGEPIDGLIWENERCIEMPLARDLMDFWAPGRILDAGCALNQFYDSPPLAQITHFTQDVTAEHRYLQTNRTYVSGDLRDLSLFADQAFDRVGCISTLEHIGGDNRTYGGAEEDDPESVVQAAQELWRVTKHRLFVTVPCYLEVYREPKWRAFTPDTLRMQLLTYWPGAVVRYYSLTPDGWCGPFDEPQPDTAHVSVRKVHQIAAIVVTR